MRFLLRTAKRAELVDITSEVQATVGKSKAKNGVCTVFVPHTTAAVTINEGHDPDVAADILSVLERLVPHGADYSHAEGNSDAHIKSSLVGSSVNVIFEDGKLFLGTWQKIFFCEFDGPRERKVFVEVAGKN